MEMAPYGDLDTVKTIIMSKVLLMLSVGNEVNILITTFD